MLCDVSHNRYCGTQLTMQYIALLRGINVGGNALIKMSALKVCLEGHGFHNVRTYIQSGNVLFASPEKSTALLAQMMSDAIEKEFNIPVRVVVMNEVSYTTMIAGVPKGWGEASDWKYNLLFLIPPYSIDEIIKDIGELKPDIELLKRGEGVLYQAVLFSAFGRSTTGKLASRASYQKMTVRNWNTARKLRDLLDAA